VQLDLRLKPQLASAHLLVKAVNANVDFVSFNPDNSADRLFRNPVPHGQLFDSFARLMGSKNLAISHRCFLNHCAGAPAFAEQKLSECEISSTRLAM
jgi:hypothetical protein